jgi:hypothetical protein
MAEQVLNIKLVENPLTPEPNDFSGRIQLNGTFYNRDIAAEYVRQRTEYRAETIVNIMDVTDGIKREKIASGYSVIDGVAQMRASVTGTFRGEAAQFNENEHSIGVIMTPSPQMRKEIKASKVRVNGATRSGPVINTVEGTVGNVKKCENGVMTPGRNLRIHGDRIRIAFEPEYRDVAGVWIIAADPDATEKRIHVEFEDMSDNEPSKVTILVPPLSAGGYFIEVVTQNSTSTKYLLKEPRTYRFETMLTVE